VENALQAGGVRLREIHLHNRPRDSRHTAEDRQKASREELTLAWGFAILYEVEGPPNAVKGKTRACNR